MEQTPRYLFSLNSPCEGFFRDRGSKFYAFAYPVEDESQIQQKLDGLRKKYHDARHHCYAWRLGIKGDTVFANDDREPAHSAGDPILGQIRAEDLTNVLVVVIRYFGGTKLGIRGLIEAYKNAAADALSNSPKTELVPSKTIRIHFPYNQTSGINRILHKFPHNVIDSSYTDSCSLTLSIEERLAGQLEEILQRSGIKFVNITV